MYVVMFLGAVDSVVSVFVIIAAGSIPYCKGIESYKVKYIIIIIAR